MVAENATTTDSVGTVSTTDPDLDPVSYAITGGNGAGKFKMSTSTGEITVAGALDHGTAPSYTLTVEARDDGDGVATTTVGISVIEASCSNGVAVPSPADNPGLVGDCTVLLTIRDTLAGTATLNWNAFTAVIDWQGITVGGTPRRVTKLSMPQSNLSGTIPASLRQLGNLEELDLGGNSLTGTIPSELGDLALLKQLSLYDNRLTGEIPSELGSLARLERLTIFGNQLTGEIPSELGGLTNLRQLYLSSNSLSGPIPPELGQLSRLETLSLNTNQLTGAIPSEFGGLTELRSLFLHSNSLSGPIPPELGLMTALRTIWLQRNQLSGEIPSELGSLTNLANLSLVNNSLTGAIPWELGGLSGLRTLHLSSNQLEGCVPPALRSIGDNDLSGLGLSDCSEEGPAPAPSGLRVTVADDTFSITWSAVTGADRYEVSYRAAGTEDEWESVGTSTSTALTYSPGEGPACGTEYEFTVRSHGDAVTYATGWGAESDASSVTTAACSS